MRATPQKLGLAGIDHRLQALRVFQITWPPNEAFKTPDHIRAAYQPNPRDIQEDTWFKLIWAACTLTKDKLLLFKRSPNYPLAYYRYVNASFTVRTTTILHRGR